MLIHKMKNKYLASKLVYNILKSLHNCLFFIAISYIKLTFVKRTGEKKTSFKRRIQKA